MMQHLQVDITECCTCL